MKIKTSKCTCHIINDIRCFDLGTSYGSSCVSDLDCGGQIGLVCSIQGTYEYNYTYYMTSTTHSINYGYCLCAEGYVFDSMNLYCKEGMFQ